MVMGRGRVSAVTVTAPATATWLMSGTVTLPSLARKTLRRGARCGGVCR
jgi:hypothetical protein